MAACADTCGDHSVSSAGSGGHHRAAPARQAALRRPLRHLPTGDRGW